MVFRAYNIGVPEQVAPRPFNMIPLGSRRRFGKQDSCITFVEETVEVDAKAIPDSSHVAAPIETSAEIPGDFEMLMMLLTSVQRILRRYEVGDRLSEEDQEFVKEKLLPYHPGSAMKIGRGIDYIKVDNPPAFPQSKCMFVVRSDGSSDDFSYLKCLRGWVQKTFPSELAERALRYLTRRRQSRDGIQHPQPSDVPGTRNSSRRMRRK